MNARSLLVLLLVTSCLPLVADELTTDPPVIWDTPCAPCPPPRCSSCPVPLSEEILSDGITVDLRNPLYSDGILSTEEGGVLTGPAIRIQAKKIVYTKRLDEEPPIFTVYCEGDLLIEYKDRVLVGHSICFDFLTQTGTLICGRTALAPWYVGGEIVELCANGDLVIQEGYLTTSEGGERDLEMRAGSILLTTDQQLTARHVTFRIRDIPVFALPKIHLDIHGRHESPLGVTFAWGGFPGTQLGIRYKFLDWHDFKAYARIDAFFGQGYGGGIETQFCPSGSNVEWYTRNYYAHDIAIYDPKRRDRYRFQGTYFNRIWHDKTTVSAIYDFVSDPEMASEYNTKDFELKTANKTKLELRHQEDFWIARLKAIIRVNSFQSVNQELPGFTWSCRPFELPGTGIIAENIFKAAYLNYKESTDIPYRVNLHSGRVEVRPRVYRPFFLGPVTVTPEAAFIGIGYSNSPSGNPAGQAVGDFGVRTETALSKRYSSIKHVFEPYSHYHLLATSRIRVEDDVPHPHYFIFALNDTYSTLNLMRFGMRNSFFTQGGSGFHRPLWIDLWANAFFDSKTLHHSVPKAYLNMEWIPFSRMLLSLESAWNIQKNALDYYNVCADWTLSDHFAIGAEYRHRGPYDWRKADFYNFIIENVYTNRELKHSPFSDRRDTALLRFFYRVNPDWWTKFQIRHGWHRRKPQKPYTEYDWEIGTVLFQHWRISGCYESRESDHRFSFTFKLDPTALCK